MKYLICALSLAACLSAAADAERPERLPQELTSQVERLVALLSDGYAVGVPKATQVQSIGCAGADNIANCDDVALVVFSMDSFGLGSNWSQYVAAFVRAAGKNGVHDRLLDVIRIGGGGWRSIVQLNAQVGGGSAVGQRADTVELAIPALENVTGDSVNHPTGKTTIFLTLKSGRLAEHQGCGTQGHAQTKPCRMQ